MAKSIWLLFLSLLILSTSFSFDPTLADESKSPNHSGLTLELIHHDSPQSPLYKPNLTDTERIQNRINQSLARSLYLLSSHDDSNSTDQQLFNTNVLRAKVDQQPIATYLVQVSIGTFTPPARSHIPYFLHLDTGSSLTWTQCEGCRAPGHHCFGQRQVLFPDLRSRTYRKLPCGRHPLCYPNECLQNFCTYRATYFDGAATMGFLASESFVFGSTQAPREMVILPNIVFGCGFNQLGMESYERNGGSPSGRLGLGWGPRSFVSQLGARAGSRFSYCLQRPGGHGQMSLLRFGSDIPSRPGLSSTELVQVGTRDPYFVNLIDISIAGRRLQIPQIYFSRRPHNPVSGVVFDSGADYTRLVQPARALYEAAMERYLLANIMGLRKTSLPNLFRMCYERQSSRERRGFRDLPSVTFHFSNNANMVVHPGELFVVLGQVREQFCLVSEGNPYSHQNGGLSIIGAYQQRNHRVIYDLGRRRLSFAPEDCSQGG